MTRIDKLIYLAIIPPFLIALTVLTFVVFIHDIGRLSELLITHNASLSTIAIIAGTVLPSILIFSLPLSFLIGILIGLSGLSGESQITALRACGVPIRKLLRPIITLGTLVGLVTGTCSVYILPETNDILGLLRTRVSLRQTASLIQPRVFIDNDEIRNLVVYLDDIAADKQHWSRVFLVDNSNIKAPRTLMARTGRWVSDTSDSQLQLHLENGTIYEVDPSDPRKDNVSVFAATDIPVDINRNAENQSGAQIDRRKKPMEQRTAELWTGRTGTSSDERLDQLIELHRRLAMPFTVFPFGLLGLTLGISAKKGGRTLGSLLSLGSVILFYILFFNGIRLAHAGKVAPGLGTWSADILLTVLGIALLVNIESRSRLMLWLSLKRTPTFDRLFHPIGFKTLRNRLMKLDISIAQYSSRLAARFRFPKIFDVYVSRGFLVYFFWSLLVCVCLFIIVTLFDLLDDILRNRTPMSFVVDYFVFLTPYILMFVIPMSVLLAILINFGILEKNSEVTAMKAGGWSLYRIAMPIFLLAGVISVNLYLMQDYIVPYANIRQDSIRNIIKGKPARTSKSQQRKWIFGESNRIFNYEYYDAARRTFIDLNIYEVDLHALKILERIRASRAWIDETGKWHLEDGWVRNFQSERQGFRNITSEEFSFPEKPQYFESEIFEPKESSKLTYFELKDKINYLRKAGYNATELQVELYKKISFPLSCIVMAVLGVPFSFFMGRKGAFFGITASVAIAISYWGVFSVFETMGSYGLLIPLLAAWAPNLLFAAGGLVLFFTIRT